MAVPRIAPTLRFYPGQQVIEILASETGTPAFFALHYASPQIVWSPASANA